MSELRIYPDSPDGEVEVLRDAGAIASTLASHGVLFERWSAEVELPPGAGQDDVLSAYAGPIGRLRSERGYQAADVVRMTPGAPNVAEARGKFLREHTHAEDEVRFFVEGSGAFYLHLERKVFQVICERGDLLGVPAGLRHWFDMGPKPAFTAIRLFTNPEGWAARFTGDEVADRIPRFGE